jgi:hypothetical protein
MFQVWRSEFADKKIAKERGKTAFIHLGLTSLDCIAKMKSFWCIFTAPEIDIEVK